MTRSRHDRGEAEAAVAGSEGADQVGCIVPPQGRTSQPAAVPSSNPLPKISEPGPEGVGVGGGVGVATGVLVGVAVGGTGVVVGVGVGV